MEKNSQSRNVRPALGLLLSLALALTLAIGPALGAAQRPEPAAPEELTADGWLIERIDDPKLFYDMSDRSLALDSKNRPHIAYGGDHLYYAWNDGTQWNFMTVDAEYGVGQSASLSVDRNDRPHISYYDQVNGRLKYAHYDGANWLIEVVDTSPLAVSLDEWAAQAEPTLLENRLQDDLRPWETEALLAPLAPDRLKPGVGRYNSIATSAANAPTIAYYDAVNGDLRVARRTGSGWEITVVEGTKEDTGKYVSLAIDVNNHLHVSYLDDSNESLKYAYYDGSWTTETVDSDGVGAYTSIAVESEDALPQISYYDFFEGDLMYASPRTTGTWRIDRVDQSGNTGLYSSITLDSNDHPHIAYYDESAGDMKYAYYDGTSWNTERLYTTGNVGLWPSIALTPDDLVRVSYYSASAAELKYAAQDSDGDWPSTPTRLDEARDVGKASSLNVDQFGRPQVTYLDDTRDDLYYAWFDAAQPKWVIGPLVSEDSVGLYSSIDTFGGVPQVAYYDSSAADLRLLRAQGSAWISETVDSPSSESVDAGLYASLRLTSAGNPRIAYYDSTNGDLKFASRDGTSSWQITRLDGVENDLGRYVSMALNGADAPFISYYDVEKGNLKVAVKDIDWVRQVVDGEINNKDVGRYSSIAMGAGDFPGIAYYNVTDKDLMYAQLVQNVGWQVETVDAAGDVGQFASLGYDAAGTAYIAYYDATNQNLKIAVRKNGVWTTGALDTYGNVGQYASLYVDAAGSPHITYYDATSGDLKYARGYSSSFGLYLPLISK